MIKKSRILNKLILNGFVTVIISFVIAGTILLGFAVSSAELAAKEKENMITQNAGRVAEFSLEVFTNTWSPLSVNYKSTLSTIADSIGANIIVFNSNAQIVAVGGLEANNFIGRALSGEFVKKILDGESITKTSNIEIFENENMLVVGMPIKSSITYGGVLVSTPAVDLKDTYIDVLVEFGLSAVIALIIAFIIFYYMSKKITEPIKSMNNAVVEFSRGDFKKRVNCTTNDELKSLAENINNMAESIENLEQSRSAFISDVSHELRTPMTSVTGFVEGMLDGTIPPQKHKEYLEIVYAECRRLSRLVDDLLKLSRFENDKIQINKRIFNINELIRICILRFEQEINAKNIDVNLDFENENTDAYADSDAITQVVTNIVHNAVKFTPEKGSITIKTYEKSGKILVEVTNSGEGISKEKLKYIWDRFYKTDTSRGFNPDGVGLGLYIVKSIINQHKEKIWAESEEGKWAKFVFTLSKQ